MAMQVREIMTTSVESITSDTDIVTAALRMREIDTGALPVVDGGQLVGIITDRDIVLRVVAEGLQPQNEQVGSYLSANPTTITPDADAREAADLMAREQIRRLPVVDNGQLVGFLSIGDLAVELNKDKVVGNALEQISEPAQPRNTTQ